MTTYVATQHKRRKMASRVIGCAVTKVFRPGLAKFGRSTSNLSLLGRQTSAQSLGCVGSQPGRAVLGGQPWLMTSCYSTQPDVFTVPPQPLAKETSAVGQSVDTLANVNVDLERRLLNVSWEGGSLKNQVYPFVWLRDNCHCPQCLHPTALGRQPDAQHLIVDTTADVVEVSPDGRSVIIQWDDGHKSEFLSHWLRYYRFDQSQDDQLMRPKPKLWGSDVNIKRFQFDELLAEDYALYDWLSELVTNGVAIVKNVPEKVGQVSKLAERVAYLRATSYGTTWHVLSKPNPSSVGYTTGAFAMHTDYTSLSRMPGVLLLHCIKQTAGKGGESLLVDGFKVAMDLKKLDPEAFRLLTTYSFDYTEQGNDSFGRFYMRSRHPVIRLDEFGDVEQIAISNHSRDPMLRAPVDQIHPLYRAFDKYFNMLRLPEYLLQYKLQEGDMLTNDNRRVLHGRNSFKVSETNFRHLEGGYVEWDEVNSRLRSLALQTQEKATGER